MTCTGHRESQSIAHYSNIRPSTCLRMHPSIHPSNTKCLLFGRHSQVNETDAHKTFKNIYTSILSLWNIRNMSYLKMSDVRLITHWTVETMNSTRKINKKSVKLISTRNPILLSHIKYNTQGISPKTNFFLEFSKEFSKINSGSIWE